MRTSVTCDTDDLSLSINTRSSTTSDIVADSIDDLNILIITDADSIDRVGVKVVVITLET